MIAFGVLSFGLCAQAQPLKTIDWETLVDPAAQHFEDPYRDLSSDQFQSLMALARLQIALDGDLTEGERADLDGRVSELSQDLQEQGLDPEWILAQREAVAARREHAATATNAALEGEQVELSGYLLVAPDVDGGKLVAHLLPDRGVCMHLPPPAPNQLIRLVIDRMPHPLGPCIATSVRGRLAPHEFRATVPVFDDTVLLWSRWQLEVREVITAGSFSINELP